MGTKRNIQFLIILEDPKSPQKSLPGARNQPRGLRNEVPEPSRTIPGSANIRHKKKQFLKNKIIIEKKRRKTTIRNVRHVDHSN